MKPSVRSYFREFNEPLEGAVPWMYLDVKGLVTVGVGNLIDPLPFALELPFRWKSTRLPANKAAIAAEWRLIKANKSLAKRGHLAAQPLTHLELADEEIDRVIYQRLDENEAIISRTANLQHWESWPADSQLGIHSMAWAMGVGGVLKFKNFMAGAKVRNFVTMALECAMKTVDNPGLIPRNERNAVLFCNADEVVKRNLDPDVLHFPESLKSKEEIEELFKAP